MQKAQERGKTRGRHGHGCGKTKQGHGLAIERSRARMQMRVRGGVPTKVQQRGGVCRGRTARRSRASSSRNLLEHEHGSARATAT